MSAIGEAQVEQWRSAIGREIIESQQLDELALRRFAKVVGGTADLSQTPLPHWAFFLPCPADEEIGADGHPERGGFLPDVSLPRRMFAAARMEFPGIIETGIEGRLTSRIADVSHKSGRSGDLVFVEVERVLEQSGTERVRERQTYVYRGDGEPVAMPEPSSTKPAGAVWQPDEVNLFRFSAATFNGHRIHYDEPYATEVEGYPALVVHGPFTAARLAALAMREGPLASFSFRAMAPLFLGQPIYLVRISDGEYAAIRCDGTTAMQAAAIFR